MRKSARLFTTAAFCVVLSAPGVARQAHPQYRTYWMGDDMSVIATQLGVAMPSVRLVPSTLGGLTELTWEAEYVHRDTTSASSPVARLVFSFYEDQLFRIVIDYAYHRTEGMTEADMVEAISAVYGQPAKRIAPISPTSARGADATIARWRSGDSAVALLRVEPEAAFRAIVVSPGLEARARAAGAYEPPAELRGLAIDAGAASAADPAPRAAREQRRRTNIASFIP
jgi:hypothetical protein